MNVMVIAGLTSTPSNISGCLWLMEIGGKENGFVGAEAPVPLRNEQATATHRALPRRQVHKLLLLGS